MRMLSNQGRPAARGFTLIEVMVATAVMAIGLVSALQIFSSSMQLAGASASQTEALVLARSLMDEALWRPELIEESYNGEAGRYAWTVEIFPVERSLISLDEVPGLAGDANDNGDYELYEIHASVVWSARGGEKRIDLFTARLAEKDL